MKETLERYYEEGLLYKQIHPTLPLTIWNYTPTVQYGQVNDRYKLWDDVTIQTRGLVTDNEGNVVARPFKKFFNVEEQRFTPTKQFDVYEKMDGSLGILFNYKGEWVMATRGSFTSEQSVKGFELLQKYEYNKLNKSYTYLFEIIYSKNRIVLNYDFEDLVLLGVINTEDGYEFDIHNNKEINVRLVNTIKNIGFRVVQKFDGINDYSTLKSMIPDNKEGFVIKFSNGDRIKVKGDEYLRLHKIMTDISTTKVWEVLSNGGNFNDFLNNVPDEFYEKIKSYEKDLRYSHFSISEYCGKLHDGFRYGKYGDKEEPTKKEYAEFVMKNVKEGLRPVMFYMWDKKDYSSVIWKLIRPEFRKL